MSGLKMLATIIVTLAVGSTGVATVSPPSGIAANVDAALGQIRSTLRLETQARVGTQRRVQNAQGGAVVMANGQTNHSAPIQKGNPYTANTTANMDGDVSVNAIGQENASPKAAAAIANEFGVAVDDVTALHDKGWGYGEIENLYKMGQVSGATLSLIESMRASGKGWGEIAQALGFSGSGAGKNLGGIVSADGALKLGHK